MYIAEWKVVKSLDVTGRTSLFQDVFFFMSESNKCNLENQFLIFLFLEGKKPFRAFKNVYYCASVVI